MRPRRSEFQQLPVLFDALPDLPDCRNQFLAEHAHARGVGPRRRRIRIRSYIRSRKSKRLRSRFKRPQPRTCLRNAPLRMRLWRTALRMCRWRAALVLTWPRRSRNGLTIARGGPISCATRPRLGRVQHATQRLTTILLRHAEPMHLRQRAHRWSRAVRNASKRPLHQALAFCASTLR